MLENKKEYCNELIDLLSEEDLSVCILFVIRDKANDSYEVFKGNLINEVGNNLREICLKVCKKSYSKPDKKTFDYYNPSKKGNQHTEFLEGEELEKIRPLMNIFESKVVDLKKLDKKFLDNLWFYIIKLENKDKKALFFKKYSQSMILTKSFPLAMTFRAGDFDRLKQNIFMITKKVDCIYFQDKLIIRCKGNFEKIFNFFQKIKSNALSAVNIVKNLPFKIDKIDKLKETWMGHEMMIRKLNNIYSKKTMEKIKLKNIENLISRGILKGVTAKKEKDGKLLLSSEDPWKILNILDDDYVRSLLTGINYEASDKKQIQINNH